MKSSVDWEAEALEMTMYTREYAGYSVSETCLAVKSMIGPGTGGKMYQNTVDTYYIDDVTVRLGGRVGRHLMLRVAIDAIPGGVQVQIGSIQRHRDQVLSIFMWLGLLTCGMSTLLAIIYRSSFRFIARKGSEFMLDTVGELLSDPSLVDPLTIRRSSNDRVIAGVLGGIGHRFGIPTGLLRAAFIVGAILSSGTLVIGYVVLCVTVPAPRSMRDRPSR